MRFIDGRGRESAVDEDVDVATQNGFRLTNACLHERVRSIFGARVRPLTANCLVVAVLLATVGCAPSVARTPTSTPNGQPLSGKLTIGGSTALQPLVEQAARDFQGANPGVEMAISGEGSGAGRNNVCEGSLDIGFSDVPLTDAESSLLKCGDAVQTAVAIQAFAVVANPTGPGGLKALDREQMQNIFSGAVKDWSEVQGARQPLIVINRIRGSGTRQSMANYIFGGDDSLFARGIAEEESNQKVANTVASTPGAISYLGLAYLNTPNMVTLGIQRPDGIVLPTRDVVAGLHWPIGGPGLAITKGQPNGLAAAFLNFMIGPKFASDPVWDSLGYVVPATPAIGNAFGQ